MTYIFEALLKIPDKTNPFDVSAFLAKHIRENVPVDVCELIDCRSSDSTDLEPEFGYDSNKDLDPGQRELLAQEVRSIHDSVKRLLDSGLKSNAVRELDKLSRLNEFRNRF